jgi:hypothetical protein
VLFFAATASAAVLRHALVVGANVGGAGLEPLRYAEDDARRFADVLVELGEFEPVHITVLYAPTEAELKAAVRAHSEIAGAFDDDLFLFYYSGHADGRGLRVGSDTYDWEKLRADIREVPAEVKVGVLDACRSGSITRLKGAALSQPFLAGETRLAAEGEAWIAAASEDEDAQESENLRGSFFTHYLISGLRGAADRNDGAVSLEEVWKYARDRVVSHTGESAAGVQHPSRDFRLKGQDDLVLTTVREGSATVGLPDELAGQITVVRLPDRTPVAEVAKPEGVPVTLALPPGSYALRKMDGQTLLQAEVLLRDGTRVMAPAFTPLVAPTSDAPKGAELSAFDARAAAAQRLDLLTSAAEIARANQGWWAAAVNDGDLRHSPLVASGLSLILPGAGQIYNQQGVKGGLLMAGTFALFAGSVFVPDRSFFSGSITGPDPLALGAAMLYGTAVADAAWNANPHPGREARHPSGGGTLSTYAGWDPSVGADTPYVAGISGEWWVTPNLALGVDRVGWTRQSELESRWNFGSRVSFAVDGDRWRPYAFVAGGGRVIETADRDATDAGTVGRFAAMERQAGTLTSGATGESRLVGVIGGGVGVRYYVTPRYFLETEARAEVEDAAPRVLLGGGIGVHLGG